MNRLLCLLPLALIAWGCANRAAGPEPSLAPRAAEAIDPRLAVPDTSGQLPSSAALRSQAEALLGQAQAGQGAFERAAAEAERLAASADGPGGEGWIAAQQALSGAVAARYPVTRALGDADALVAEAVVSRGGLVPADLVAVRRNAVEIAAINAAQAARIDALQARLAR